MIYVKKWWAKTFLFDIRSGVREFRVRKSDSKERRGRHRNWWKWEKFFRLRRAFNASTKVWIFRFSEKQSPSSLISIHEQFSTCLPRSTRWNCFCLSLITSTRKLLGYQNKHLSYLMLEASFFVLTTLRAGSEANRFDCCLSSDSISIHFPSSPSTISGKTRSEEAMAIVLNIN